MDSLDNFSGKVDGEEDDIEDEAEENEDGQNFGQDSQQSITAQFPPSGRTVQEYKSFGEPPLGDTEVALVKYPLPKNTSQSKAHSIPISASENSSSLIDSLDNFSGKVDGEEDGLEGKAEEEEDEEDDLLRGEAVTALDSNPLLDSNQTPAAVEAAAVKETDSNDLDWIQKENSDLPSVDIGKIKSILDETAD